MFAASRAGMIAARAVTITPSTTIHTARSVGRLMAVPPKSMPKRVSTRCSTETRPIPPAMPAVAPTAPMNAACTSRVSSTWTGEAPTARSRAYSRCRWRTSIAKVLKIRNEPTNRAIRANTRMKVSMKPRASCVAERDSSRMVSAVTASTPVPSSACRASATACAVASGSTRIAICGTRPSGAKAASPSCGEMTRMVAPRSGMVYSTSPTIVTSRGGRRPAESCAVSPTLYPDFSRVGVSRAISSSAAGRRPSRTVAVSRSSHSTQPNDGACELVTASPSAPTT